MKIALSIDYGMKFPEALLDINKEPYPNCRIDIVNYIEEHGNLMSTFLDGTLIYKLDGCIFKIEDVDISRPWRITYYDTAEYIQYLDYDVVNEELNYCELKDE